MHICFITSEYPKEGFPHGGVGTFIRTLSKKLVAFGVKVSIVGINYINKNEVEDDEGVKIHRLNKYKVKGITWILNSKKINKCLKNINSIDPIDIIEGRELDLAFLKKIHGIKYVIRLNGGHHFFAKYENRKVKMRHAFMEKKSFRKADALIAVSDFVGNETLNLLGISDRTYYKVFNPVDINKFYQCDVTKVNNHSIFFAGTIIEKKGIRQLVESLNYLVDDFPDVKLYIAGRDANLPGTTIPYRPILEKSITDKIKNHIEFLGVVPNNEIPMYIEKSHVCCYPSHMEAMPLAWLEVMAMGKIFIGSTIGPGFEAVIDGKTGFLVNHMNPHEIAEKIKFVFNNSEVSQEIAINGRQRIFEEFDISIIVEKNIDVYKEILLKD